MSKFILGDCMGPETGLPSYPDNYFDLAIVDPPYGIGADVNQQGLSGKKGFTKNAGRYKTYQKTNWDSSPPDLSYFNELQRVSKNQIIWGGNYFKSVGLQGVIVWYKKGSGNFKEGELAKSSFNTFKVFTLSRADAYINLCDEKIHPTQKPTILYQQLLENYAKPGDLILDTHVGSASSLIACESMGFEYVGYEIDPDYYAAAKNRMSKGIQLVIQ